MPLRQTATAAAFAATALTLLAACGTTASTTASPPPASTHAAVPAAAASPLCANVAVAWKNSGGSGEIVAVGNDMTQLQTAVATMGTDMQASGAASASDSSAVQTAAVNLQTDAQTAQSGLAPACIPHARQDETAMLNFASKSAIACQDAISEIGSGSYDVADADIRQASVNIGLADAMLGEFTKSLGAWEKAGEP